MEKDLTQGKVSKVILGFSIPLLISSTVQQLYNMADSAIVGKLDSASGLAAIGGAYPITLFIIGICTGAGMGCTVVISRLFGEKELQKMKSAMCTSLIAFGTIGIILTLIGVLMAGTFMRWLGVNDEVFDGARSYLAIYSVGAMPMLVYNAAAAAFTGIGDSKRPLYFLISSSVLNIILDIIAVGPLKMGVQGAAWATVISQVFVAALSLTAILKKIKHIGNPDDKIQIFSWDILKKITSVALPCILQQLVVSLGGIFLQTIVNSYGTAVMAGHEVGSKIVNFVYGCFNAMATGMMSFAGQNYGAGKIDRCKQGFRTTAIVCVSFAVIVALILLFIPEVVVGLFVNSAEANISEVVAVGSAFMRIISVDFIFIGFFLSIGGLMRGVGSIKYFVVATIADFGTRVGFSFILTHAWGNYTGLYWAYYFGMVVDMVMCLIWLFRWMAKNRNNDKEEAAA